jgi:hypothetical protein
MRGKDYKSVRGVRSSLILPYNGICKYGLDSLLKKLGYEKKSQREGRDSTHWQYL